MTGSGFPDSDPPVEGRRAKLVRSGEWGPQECDACVMGRLIVGGHSYVNFLLLADRDGPAQQLTFVAPSLNPEDGWTVEWEAVAPIPQTASTQPEFWGNKA